jgi:membrane protease YdiL (CAAX protease family)
MNWRKINLYILLAFAFSWAAAIILKLAHIDITGLKGKVILALLYMPAPALSTFVVQKFIYKEDFTQYGWTFNKKAVKWILFTPLLFLTLSILTLTIIALFGNTHLAPAFGHLDFSQENFNHQLKETVGATGHLTKMHIPNLPAYLIFILVLVSGIIAGASVNLPFMFGEEFGWRGLMLWETKHLGFLGANCFIGLIWGIWHWPVILMGFNYPHHPYIGLFMMVLFTMSLSPLFAYVRIKTKSILGPCMLHGMINATGAMYIMFVADGNELYSSIAGWAGIIAGVVLTIVIVLFDKKFIAEYSSFE